VLGGDPLSHGTQAATGVVAHGADATQGHVTDLSRTATDQTQICSDSVTVTELELIRDGSATARRLP
jgi:hypothetical protein